MHFKKFGKYTIIKKLTSGGMADILLASDLSPTGFGRFVVIKRALSKFSENEEFKDMFKNEGKVACNLKHRNIIPIYEFGIEKNQFFLSMEYISGRNLRELIKKLKAYKSLVSIPNSVHIIKEVSSGLNYAHNAIDANTGQPLNLIHRDVSPQNIMMSFDGEIKIIDFGIAKISDTNLTRAGHLKGKISYMSPEQANGESLDERTDIFCLGIVLWELLTGKRLFASQNELTSLKKIKNCDIPDAQKINPKIPTELNNIIKNALSKNRNSRYKTAAKLEQDLSIFLNKNYPEYSHYDFISLMKTTYKREILEERENLKNYSGEFNKYLNSLNIENSLKPQIDLNIPDLSTLIEGQSRTKSFSTKQNSNFITNNQPLSNYESHFDKTMDESQTVLLTSQIMKEKSTTLIQKSEADTQTKENATETKKAVTQANPIKQDFPLTKDGSLAVDLGDDTQFTVKSTNYFKGGTQSQQSLRPTQLYSKKEIWDNLIPNKKKKYKKALFFSVALLTSFAFAVYWIVKNDNRSKNFLRNTSPKEASLTKSIKQKRRLATGQGNFSSTKSVSTLSGVAGVSSRKVLVSSKPSGAAIFVNNRFSSKYTPSLITLTKQRSSNITLKKKGYFTKNFTFDPKKQKNNALKIKLTVDHQQDTASDTVHIIQ